MVEVLGGRADDAIAAMRIPERQRDRPRHVRVIGDLPIGLPGHVVRRVADPEDRVEQQVQRTGARTDDQVGARNRVCEARARLVAHFLHTEQQRHADGDRKDRQQCSAASVPEAAERECGNHHGERAGPMDGVFFNNLSVALALRTRITW